MVASEPLGNYELQIQLKPSVVDHFKKMNMGTVVTALDL